MITDAIDAGQTIIREGKPKIDAAMAIYRMLKHLDQQKIVGALINGANLTPVDAVAYRTKNPWRVRRDDSL